MLDRVVEKRKFIQYAFFIDIYGILLGVNCRVREIEGGGIGVKASLRDPPTFSQAIVALDDPHTPAPIGTYVERKNTNALPFILAARTIKRYALCR